MNLDKFKTPPAGVRTTPKKPPKVYKPMVTASDEEIATWNSNVKTRQKSRRAARQATQEAMRKVRQAKRKVRQANKQKA